MKRVNYILARMLCSWQSQVKDYNVTALTAKICDLCLCAMTPDGEVL